MFKQEKLENLIKEKLHFALVDSRGFHCLKCNNCNDRKIRAGFKFESNNVIYNCWNCRTACVYNEFSGHISKKMRSVLNAFGIDDTLISNVVNSAFFTNQNKKDVISLQSLIAVNTTTPPVKLPPKSIKLGSCLTDIDYQTELVSYLLSRKVNLEKYTFYFSLDENFKNRVIVPFFRNGKIIYWQARAIDNNKKRYDNCAQSRDAVIFNMDLLNTFSKAPLFVTEGIFDAMVVDGISILGSKLTPAKIELLKNSNRRLVFVIDKDENGSKLAYDVLKLGWEITFSAPGSEDINNSMQNFGIIWTVEQLLKNITKDPDKAKLFINLNCKSK